LASALALAAIRRWRAEAATLGRSCGYIEGSLDLINAIVLATLYDPRARPSATRLSISGILGAGAAGHALHQFVAQALNIARSGAKQKPWWRCAG